MYATLADEVETLGSTECSGVWSVQVIFVTKISSKPNGVTL